MPAAYDHYDYPAYWESREYEHQSEIVALKSFLGKIKKINRLLEIGAGYGRLTPTYLGRAKKIILSDPSVKHLSIARETLTVKNIEFLQSTLENLPYKIRLRSIDLVVMVRVIHHIKDPEEALSIISKLIKKRGYLILEFANKSHFKAAFTEFVKGNFTYPLDIFSKEVRTKKYRAKKSIPFYNYHTGMIEHVLEELGFEIIEKRSVSNIRNSFFKHIFPLQFLIFLERILQKPLAFVNFGPSLFILARKTI